MAELLKHHRPLLPRRDGTTTPPHVSPLLVLIAPDTYEDTVELLDSFYNDGGNFIDVSQFEPQEWVGTWLRNRENRDKMVISVSMRMDSFALTSSFRLEIEKTLTRLGVDCIDLLFIQEWDHSLSIEETMHSLNSLIKDNKVRFIGADMLPMWVVAQANQFARDRQLHGFDMYWRGFYAHRHFTSEELQDMCKIWHMGLAVYLSDPDEGRGKESTATGQRLREVAKSHRVSVDFVDLAYALSQFPHAILSYPCTNLASISDATTGLGLLLTGRQGSD
ncbi:NADP-dependent oxidoreductase domain-containing protein [Cercophora newfieldiana]|uniref:NADP-dependent oxidoreductase domain-containing protein n=1 Tax=Cercophora newfieldiana TaxID=92897 RepID=A0AA39Y0D2_9PEZI|nr:NADP-dependent oxidoreductase domain-containing protein [Cercophora newfieldiana]